MRHGHGASPARPCATWRPRPPRMWRARPDGTEREVPATLLRPGDMFVVRPGEIIAADGQVPFGQTAVDRSMMTRESVPAEATEGDSGADGTVAITGRWSSARSRWARILSCRS